ncbi:MAG TPA: LemA family protein [Thermoleophilaceae bacterium]|nr:LemA family protein [Thermoleophilaceae bacterium]
MDLMISVGLIAVVLLAVWAVATNNSFVRARNKVDEAWSGIDVQLKRRHDLVPNLVETVKGYAQHERETLTAVTEARAEAIAAVDPDGVAQAEAKLTSALGGIHAVAEQYPELRASDEFRELEGQLALLETEIQAARRIYNANVQAYNTRIQIFPNSLIAGRSFEARRFFQLDSPAERAVPAVAFS